MKNKVIHQTNYSVWIIKLSDFSFQINRALQLG